MLNKLKRRWNNTVNIQFRDKKIKKNKLNTYSAYLIQ